MATREWKIRNGQEDEVLRAKSFVGAVMENPAGYTHERPVLIERIIGREFGEVRIQPNTRRAIK